MVLDYLEQKHVEQEQLDFAESNFSSFFQSIGIEILDIYAYESIKPCRIAMDDVENGDTTRMVATGDIIVDISVRSKNKERVFVRCPKYNQDNLINLEVTIGTDIYFVVDNKEDLYKFKREYLLT